MTKLQRYGMAQGLMMAVCLISYNFRRLGLSVENWKFRLLGRLVGAIGIWRRHKLSI